MQNALSIWSGLDLRRRAVVIAASVGVFAAVLMLARMAARPDMALLYAGLEPAAAGEVLAALDQSATPYAVQGGSIMVPAAERDSLRLALAAQGLPANSMAGYELLDSLSGFGTTSQMFDAAYWRAKEGELARTITSAPDFLAARVHIATSASSPFRRDVEPSASVTVTAAPGALGPDRAMALSYLVASAVPGLSPQAVSIIDARSGRVVAAEDSAGGGTGPQRAADLRRNIERLLEARVGPGNAVVEVSIETVTQHEEISERRIDPESRVAISTETAERSTASSETGSGAVTVASNLPDGDGAGEGAAESEDSETRETVNYEVSETRREVVKTPGGVRRLTVAVLVDGLRGTDPQTGEPVWTPRPDEELAALRDLVAAAVGYDESRGDEITLRSMEFRPLDAPETMEASVWPTFGPVDSMRLVQLGVLMLVTLVLGLFVVRPVLAGRGAPRVTAPLAGPSGMVAAVSGPGDDADASVGSVSVPDDRALPAPSPESIPPLTGAAARRPTREAGQEQVSDPVARLRELIAERQDETVQILRSWMEDGKERAK